MIYVVMLEDGSRPTFKTWTEAETAFPGERILAFRIAPPPCKKCEVHCPVSKPVNLPR